MISNFTKLLWILFFINNLVSFVKNETSNKNLISNSNNGDNDLIYSDSNHGDSFNQQQILLINHGGGARSSIRRTGLLTQTFNPHVSSYPNTLFDQNLIQPNDKYTNLNNNQNDLNNNNLIPNLNDNFNEIPYYRYDNEITRNDLLSRREFIVPEKNKPNAPPPPSRFQPIIHYQPKPPPPPPLPSIAFSPKRTNIINHSPNPTPPPPPPPPPTRPSPTPPPSSLTTPNLFTGLYPPTNQHLPPPTPTLQDFPPVNQVPNSLFNPLNFNPFFFNGNDDDNYGKPVSTPIPPPSSRSQPQNGQNTFFSYFDPPFSSISTQSPPPNHNNNQHLFQRRKLALTNSINDISNSIGYPPYNYYRGDDDGAAIKWPKIFKFTDGRADLTQFEKEKKRGKVTFSSDEDYFFENVKRESFLILHGGAYSH